MKKKYFLRDLYLQQIVSRSPFLNDANPVNKSGLFSYYLFTKILMKRQYEMDPKFLIIITIYIHTCAPLQFFYLRFLKRDSRENLI